ncbi:hypothetical protein CYMTET_52411 [Cymbomonas tetramitiformis]|uniref:Anoctamin transmembrane domain-containing protein n=1 Tax=Cymbomonas tetramitiformis TaxID=36881 RepID=A0AAE0ERD0_9CHLO|nr:hypothetical protein CYMTET_52411 [Cymbomonas tetramitiformis]
MMVLLPSSITFTVVQYMLGFEQTSVVTWNAMLVILAASLFLKRWRRLTSELNLHFHKHGLVQELQLPRPEFRGETAKIPSCPGGQHAPLLHAGPGSKGPDEEMHLIKPNLITGRLEPYYPLWKRRAKQVVSTVVVVLGMVGSAMFQLEIHAGLTGSEVESKVVAGFAVSIIIPVLNGLWRVLSLQLSAWENYLTRKHYETAFTTKVFPLQAVNSYASCLLLLAFNKFDFDDLGIQVMAILFTRFVTGFFTEYKIPQSVKNFRMKGLMERQSLRNHQLQQELAEQATQRSAAESPYSHCRPGQVREMEAFLAGVQQHPNEAAAGRAPVEASAGPEPVDVEDSRGGAQAQAEGSALGLLDLRDETPLEQVQRLQFDSLHYKYFEYSEVVIQYGYIVMFAACFPVGILLAVFSNVFEIWGDIYKLVYLAQRPLSVATDGIGAWYHITRVFSILACFTNAAIVVLVLDTKVKDCNTMQQTMITDCGDEDMTSASSYNYWCSYAYITAAFLGLFFLVECLFDDSALWVRVFTRQKGYETRTGQKIDAQGLELGSVYLASSAKSKKGRNRRSVTLYRRQHDGSLEVVKELAQESTERLLTKKGDQHTRKRLIGQHIRKMSIAFLEGTSQ